MSKMNAELTSNPSKLMSSKSDHVVEPQMTRDDFSFSTLSAHQQQVKMASPALPILGSTLLKLSNEKCQNQNRKRVGASFDPIDAALKGGLDYGRISCISGDKSQGKTTVGVSQLFVLQICLMILLPTSTLNLTLVRLCYT